MKFINKKSKNKEIKNLYPSYGTPRDRNEKLSFDNRYKFDDKKSFSTDAEEEQSRINNISIRNKTGKRVSAHIMSIFRPESGSHTAEEVIGLFVTIFVVLLMFASAVMPDKSFSAKENRMLTTFPHLTKESVAEGTYMKDMGDYAADQFFLRNMWISLRTNYRDILGKYDSNGVYKGANDYLFEDIITPKEDQFQKNVYAVNALAIETGIPVKVLVAPDAAGVLTDYLPKYAPIRDQNKDIDRLKESLVEGIDFIDVRDALKTADPKTQLYYRTDHHWTTDGAFIAFSEAAAALNIDKSEAKYTYYAIANDFSGTLAAKSGFAVKDDTIKIFEDNNDVQYVVEYTEEAEKAASLYDLKKLNSNDKYAVFFGGNHAQVKIKTTSPSERRLLVIKDSYANSFVPFLIPYYREIVMVDPRYYYGNMRKMMKSEDLDEVLFLYNANTFFADTSMAEVTADQEISEVS